MGWSISPRTTIRCTPSAEVRDGREQASGVIRYDPDNLLVCIQFHKLAGFRAVLIHVIENNTGNSPHHIQELEGEVGICPQMSEKLFQCLRGFLGTLFEHPMAGVFQHDHGHVRPNQLGLLPKRFSQ